MLALQGTAGNRAVGHMVASLSIARTVSDDVFNVTQEINNAKPPEAALAKTVIDDKIEVDCDVYATYATRLLRAAGWTTVGHMAIVPGESTGRGAHAVALAKRPCVGQEDRPIATARARH
jgi:hypothetical protein